MDGEKTTYTIFWEDKIKLKAVDLPVSNKVETYHQFASDNEVFRPVSYFLFVKVELGFF